MNKLLSKFVYQYINENQNKLEELISPSSQGIRRESIPTPKDILDV